MTRYAKGTAVPADRSKAEIERTLTRYGADQFGYGHDQGQAVIAFRVQVYGSPRAVRLTVPLPTRDEFAVTEHGHKRAPSVVAAELEKAVRQRWRAVALIVKAKLEAVESGITSFDEEFLAHLVLPGGQTVWTKALPEIEHAFETGKAPRLLLELGR